MLVAERVAQGGERHAQAAAGGSVGLIGPQQLAKHVAAVALGLDGQVRQQRARLVAAEAGDRHIVDRDLKRAQESQR